MDLSDINKVATRKRMSTDVEKLKEKVSRETANIIKLKVAQDTAYWELKERLAAVQRDHERLQRNMVEVQMQHEAVSARLQDELRLRPETLNKLASTREICEVLEEYAGRVRASLQRTAADRALLSDAYARASAAVTDARAAADRRAHRAEADVRALRDQLKQSAEQASRVAGCAAAARQAGEAAAGEALARLAAAAADSARLRDRCEARAADVARRDALLEERERTIASQRDELAQLKAELKRRSEKTKEEDSELEREAGAASELRSALSTAELHLDKAKEEVGELRKDMAKMNTDYAMLEQRNRSLDQQLQESLQNVDELKQELKNMGVKNEELVKMVGEKDETIQSLEKAQSDLQCEIKTRTEETMTIVTEKEGVIEELHETRARADRMGNAAAEAAARTQDLSSQLVSLRAEAKRAADNAERELAERAATISTLMRDVQVESEARNRINQSLSTTRSDLESARSERTRLEEEIQKLKATLKTKEDEVGAQMKIILSMRDEKERLNEKILDLQQKIDNIQDMTREVPTSTRRARRQEIRETPEQDRLAPQRNAREPAPVAAGSSKKPDVPVPPEQPRDIFNFLSDSSMDVDAIDPVEVARRYDAIKRGAPLPTAPLRTLKRHRLDNILVEAKKRVERDSLSQIRDEIAARPKTFFKSKRAGTPPPDSKRKTK